VNLDFVLMLTLFLVGDATDEIIASFPPSIMNRPSEGMIIVAQGLLGENEEFLVYRWSLPSDTKPGTAPETPLQSFFKPATTPPTTPTTSPTTTPVTTTPPTTTALTCDQCSAGPFESQLALVGHKTTTHAKKAVKRFKKPGVGSYTPVKAPTSATSAPTSPMQAQTSAPTSQITAPTSEIIEKTSPSIAVQATSTATQPSPVPVIEPDSRAGESS